MNKIEEYGQKIFEDIRHIDEYGNEYWSARELMKTLKYTEFRKFKPIIEKAIITCERSKKKVEDHFAHVSEMVDIGSKTKRKVDNYKLTRYACYLIAMNGDPKKDVIALAKTYFAYQTRKMELIDSDLKGLSEDDKRLIVRKRVKNSNYGLNRTAVESGVKNLAEFHNAGYKGLYNGETADDIAKRKGLRYREDILDNMGSEELADNLFRIIHTENKLKRDNIDNEYEANLVHYNMGKDIRKFIKKQGGTMPEDLPKPKSSIKEIDNKKI